MYMENMEQSFEESFLSPQEIEYNERFLDSLLTDVDFLQLKTEEAKQKRSEAIESLANGINDAKVGAEVVDLMVDYVENRGLKGVQTLYAYMSVIYKANEAEDFNVPNSFISYVADLAKSHGEDAMAGDIMQLRSPFQVEIGRALVEQETEIDPSAQTEPEDFDDRIAVAKPAFDAHTRVLSHDATEDLKKRLEKESESLEILIDYLVDELDTCISPDHAKDVFNFENHSLDATDLYIDIRRRLFKTAEGQRVAEAVQDHELIKKHSEDAHGLYLDIRRKRFFTSEGYNSAILKHDLMLLQKHAKDYLDLNLNIRRNRFLTIEGLRAAQLNHDLARLNDLKDSSIELKRDLKSGRFFTEEGQAGAKYRIEELAKKSNQ